jgi:CheY-like chemotaxis protein
MSEARLKGRRVLVVEDDYFLAHDLKDELAGAGAEVIGPIGRVSDALHLVTTGEPLDGAVLDINLGGQMVYAVADALRARNVPFVFTTGYDAETIPAEYAAVTRYEKPTQLAKLGEALFGH